MVGWGENSNSKKNICDVIVVAQYHMKWSLHRNEHFMWMKMVVLNHLMGGFLLVYHQEKIDKNWSCGV